MVDPRTFAPLAKSYSMKLAKLKLTNFRNIGNLSLEFEDLNVIVGPNASGKSSILEAIAFVCTGKSIRADHDKEVIKRGKDHSRIYSEITRDGEEAKLELIIVPSERFELSSKKQVKLNGVSKTLNNFAGSLVSVIFTPNDLEIVNDGPQIRRKYLDSIFLQTSKEYRTAHTNLIKVIRHRNKLLERIRDFGAGRNELGYWNDKLTETSHIIHKYRKEFFDFSKEPFLAYGKTLNGKSSELTHKYKPNLVTDERLKEYESAEIASKSTLIGPNRDDFSVTLDGLDLETYGSRGQQRMSVLALKLCEIDYIATKVHARPVLLLDDIFSELDETHKKHVFDIVRLQQTIITATDISALKAELKSFKTMELP